MEEYAHKELSHDIIGAGMKELNTLKPGLDERIYENALLIELRKRGHKVDQQRQFLVSYEGEGVVAADAYGLRRAGMDFFVSSAPICVIRG